MKAHGLGNWSVRYGRRNARFTTSAAAHAGRSWRKQGASGGKTGCDLVQKRDGAGASCRIAPARGGGRSEPRLALARSRRTRAGELGCCHRGVVCRDLRPALKVKRRAGKLDRTLCTLIAAIVGRYKGVPGLDCLGRRLIPSQRSFQLSRQGGLCPERPVVSSLASRKMSSVRNVKMRYTSLNANCTWLGPSAIIHFRSFMLSLRKIRYHYSKPKQCP
jgi:hypothetical protein